MTKRTSNARKATPLSMAASAPPSRLADHGRYVFTYGAPLALLSVLALAGVDDDALAVTAVLGALLHWFWRPLATTVLALAMVVAIFAANGFKKTYTGESIIWQDLRYVLPDITDNLGTVIQYVSVHRVVVGLALLVAAAALIRLDARIALRSRRLGLTFSLVLLILYGPQAWEHGQQVAADLIAAQRSVSGFSGHHLRSSIARFIGSLSLETAELKFEPVGSSHFAARLPSPPRPLPAASAPQHRPDIVAVFQESQFHPGQLTDCEGRQDCALQMFERGPYSRQLGPLHVHTVGWGTWNAEFAFMTGTPHTWYTGSGQYSPYTAAPRVQKALGHHLNALGYRTIVVYPTQKGMLNALNAYRSYGVQEFYGAEDLNLSLDWCELSDQTMYDTLERTYRRAREADDRPLFILMLTIFNHGPHGERCAAARNTVRLGDSADTATAKKLTDYLERSREADAASAAFRNKMLASGRSMVFLVAGDHQPSFDGLTRKFPRRPHRPMTEEQALYFTNYQIFSNLGAPPPTAHRELDIMFLSSTMLETAGVPRGPLFSANAALRDLCQGRLDQCPHGPLLDSYRQYLSETGFYR